MSERKLDHQGRWRSHTIAFRISPEENDDLNRRVKLSGLTKQDYIIRRIQERNVIVQGNPRTYKALRNQMAEILDELKIIESANDFTPDFLSLIQLVAETIGGLKEVEYPLRE